MDLRTSKERPDKKQEIMEKYNSTAQFYDERYSKIQSEKYNLVLKYDKIDKKVILDAGCGTGLLYEYFKKYRNIAQSADYIYIGIDLSWNMLEKFKQKLINFKRKNEILPNLIHCDLENLPFRKVSFDLLFSLTSLQNLADLNKGFYELLRVIKKESYILLSILKKKLEIKMIETELEQHFSFHEVIDDDKLEDIILVGKLN